MSDSEHYPGHVDCTVYDMEAFTTHSPREMLGTEKAKHDTPSPKKSQTTVFVQTTLPFARAASAGANSCDDAYYPSIFNMDLGPITPPPAAPENKSHAPCFAPDTPHKSHALCFTPDTPLFARIICQYVHALGGFHSNTKTGNKVTMQYPHAKGVCPVVDACRFFGETNWDSVKDAMFCTDSKEVRALLAGLTPFQQTQFLRMSREEGRTLFLDAKRPADPNSLGKLADRCDPAGRKLVPVFLVVPKEFRVVTELYNGNYKAPTPETVSTVVRHLIFKNKAGPVYDDEQ